MRYEIINGKVIENPSNGKKRKVDDQESPIDLEYFDYIIPQLKNLLKVIIKKLDMKYDKINFIIRHFIKSLM